MKINLNQWPVSIMLTCLGASLVGCGQGSDPLSSLGDPNQAISLSSPVANTAVNGTNFTAFSTAHPSLEWVFIASLASVAVTAPAAGIVSAVDATVNAASVTIYHNSRMSTLVSKLGSITARVGDVVTQGQQLGTLNSATPTLAYAVLLDGAAICPLSFLSAEARAFITSHTPGGANTNPCP
jgi:hypothetical protein